MRGRSNMKIKNYGAAIEAYEKAVELNPGNREAMKSLGEAYEYQGLTDKAIHQYERYLSRFSDDAGVAFKLGDFLQWSRYSYRKDDAIKYYRMGLKRNNDKTYRHKLAKLLAAEKKSIDEAIAEYKILLESDADNTAYRQEYRKLLLWDDGYLGDAIREYEKLASKNPDNYKVNYELAQLYVRDKSRSRDAIRQYEKLVKMRPQDVKLREEYARALAKDPSRHNDAKEQFEKVLASNNSTSTREVYADLLASKQSTRKEAAKQYALVLKSNPGNVSARLKYANLLGGSKETLPEAVQQYQIVLRSQPRNAAAHRGLANAYAWMGERDKAVYHSELATKYGDRGTTALKKDLMRGREPFIGGTFSYFTQPGDWYGITGILTTARGRFNPAHFITCHGEAGYETYWGGVEELGTVSGFVFKTDIEYRISSLHAFQVAYGYHSLSKAGDGNEFMLQYTADSPLLLFRGGIKRELVYESIASLAGHDAWPHGNSKYLGSARTTRFYSEVSKQYRFLEGRISPYFGWTSAESVNPNNLIGISADARISLTIRDLNRVSLAYFFESKRYERDHSGLMFPEPSDDTLPQPGGYFSPQGFVNQGPRLEYRYLDSDVQEIQACIGPSFQYSRDKSTEGSKTGLDLHLLYHRRFAENFAGTVTAGFSQSAGQYSRFALGIFGQYLF